MSFESIDENFKGWDVRLVWDVSYPSSLYTSGTGTIDNFEIYGADRSSISISRNLTRINSLEQYNQGYINGVPDIRITIFEKEEGPSFEILRRLSARNIPFDVELNLYPEGEDNDSGMGDWMNGYEKFLGCRVVNERSNYNIAEFPVREFECMALRHSISQPDSEISIGNLSVSANNVGETVEGDGTYTTVKFDLT